jgi:hypothetical protein
MQACIGWYRLWEVGFSVLGMFSPPLLISVPKIHTTMLIKNFSMFLVFSGVFTFLVDAYPLYAASAMAANTFTRTMFAGAFPLFGDQSMFIFFLLFPFDSFLAKLHLILKIVYEKLGYQWATSLLAFLALAMMPFPYVLLIPSHSLVL